MPTRLMYCAMLPAATAALLGLLASAAGADQGAMLARAKALELDTPYAAPPGDPLQHHAAGLVKVVCSAVFVSGFDADFATRNLGFFVSPEEVRSQLSAPAVDRTRQAVSVRLPQGGVRTALYLGDQGCVTLPANEQSLRFSPKPRGTRDQPWPDGDAAADGPLPAGVDAALLRRALDAAFDPAGMTAAFVVVHQGRLIAERYGDGVTPRTPLESWSMTKSLTATLLGVLMQRGVYALEQRAPIPQWQTAGDRRREIRIADLLQMSSGLRIRAPQDPDYDPGGPYPDHVYLYTGGVDAFDYAATRPLQWPPGTVGRYRNTDPVLVNYLIRLALEQRGEDYLTFPQRALFDRLGIRDLVMEVDPYGNFLGQGYALGAARDWARLGTLYLNGGVWKGERILPPDFARFVSTLAPAWQADGRPIYGGFFWLNGDGRFALPRETYFMAGAGGQFTFIVPSHELVIVRMGHYRGQSAGMAAMDRALALLMQAVPATRR